MVALDVYIISCLGFVALVGNGLILVTGVANSRLRKTSTDIATLSLSLADICMAFVTVPCYVTLRLFLPHDVTGCILVSVASLVFHLISILNLLTLTLEKFVAIRFPFLFQRFYSSTRAAQYCVLSWLVGIFLSLFPVFGWRQYPSFPEAYCNFNLVMSNIYLAYFRGLCLIILPVLFMMATQVYIYITIRHLLQESMALEVRSPQLTNMQQPVPSTSSGADRGLNQDDSSDHLKKEIRAVRRLIIYVAIFALFYFPVEVAGVIENVLSFSSQPWFYSYVNVKVWLVVLSYSSSAFNPFLYALTSKAWRQAVISTMRGKIGHVAPFGSLTSSS